MNEIILKVSLNWILSLKLMISWIMESLKPLTLDLDMDCNDTNGLDTFSNAQHSGNLDCMVHRRVVKGVPTNDCMSASFVVDDGNYHFQTSPHNENLFLSYAKKKTHKIVKLRNSMKVIMHFIWVLTTAQCPIVAFSFATSFTCHFNETFI